MSQQEHRAPRRRKLALGESGAADEQAADRAAAHALAAKPGALAPGLAGLGDSETGQASVPAPASVYETLAAPGRPLDGAQREAMEHRLGAGLGSVRLYTDADAQRSAREVDADAYSVGTDVVFGAGRLEPNTPAGRHLLAHELAHVVQDRDTGIVRRYRRRSAFAFGERDTAALVEQSFNSKTDKQTKPWIDLVTVEFTATSTDADGYVYWTGTATARYFANPVVLPSFTFPVSGGSSQINMTSPGSFTVERIEGYGYNSGSASGIPGVDFQWSEREGPHKRYSKQDPVTKERDANMSFAVFYHRGEALHAGPLDFTSHGCVHVDWDQEDLMKQLNYHSVIGLTRVKVSYAKPPAPPTAPGTP